MKTTKKLAALLLIISLTLGSCMVTKTNVGQYRETEGNTYVYAKGKQLWAFWGILPIKDVNICSINYDSWLNLVLSQYSFRELIKIAYDLKDNE